MLTKMPTETKSKTQPSQLDTKYFAGVVIVIAVLGMMGGYTIFPMLQSPKDLTITANLTNNNTNNSTTPVVKHSSVNNNSVDRSTHSHNTTTGTETTNISKNSKQTRSTQSSNQNSNNNT